MWEEILHTISRTIKCLGWHCHEPRPALEPSYWLTFVERRHSRLFLNFVDDSHPMYIESYYKILLASLLLNDIFHTPACIKIHWEFETKPLLQWRHSYHPRGSTVSTSTTCTSTVLRDLHPPWRTSISTALQPSTLGWPTSMPLRIQVVRRSYIA
jgi:hypothetical protein